MTHFPQPHPQRRAPRVQLGGSVSAMVMLEDGQHARGKLQTVSVTGGMLRLAKSLDQGDFVEVAFQTQSGPVQGMAEMLNPTRSASDGVLQPFRFIALGDDDHRTLRMVVDSVADRSFVGLRTKQWNASKLS
jgi:PilZ domain-containing protein